MNLFEFLSMPAKVKTTYFYPIEREQKTVNNHLHIHVDSNDKKSLANIKKMLLQ